LKLKGYCVKSLGIDQPMIIETGNPDWPYKIEHSVGYHPSGERQLTWLFENKENYSINQYPSKNGNLFIWFKNEKVAIEFYSKFGKI
jgi:hypothetical protein